MKSPRRPRRVRPTSLGEPEEPDEPDEPDKPKRCAALTAQIRALLVDRGEAAMRQRKASQKMTELRAEIEELQKQSDASLVEGGASAAFGAIVGMTPQGRLLGAARGLAKGALGASAKTDEIRRLEKQLQEAFDEYKKAEAEMARLDEAVKYWEEEKKSLGCDEE